MTNENLIHIKLEYGEALQLKRDMLSTEMGLLKATKIIRNYGYFRSEDLRLKMILYQRIREVRMNIGKLQKILPKLKVPEILKKDSMVDKKQEIKKSPHSDQGLDIQLKEIQNRLDELQKEKI
jgi:DNA-binding transcriptional MerR regulator